MINNKAFTLVELIVVVTILAILATIGFVSYSGYLTGVRDTNRVASLTAISDGLELYRTKNDLPLPDSSVEVQVESETIAKQGYAGSNVLQTIEYSKAGKDPKDDQYYSYYLTDDKKHYQMMAFLEESDNLESKLGQTHRSDPTVHPHPQSLSFGVPVKKGAYTPRLFGSETAGEGSSPKVFSNYSPLMEGVGGVAFAAIDYSNRHPKVYGKRLGILTDSDNTPIQEISTIKNSGNLNMTGGTVDEYTMIFSDAEAKTASGILLSHLNTVTQYGGLYPDCRTLLEKNKSLLEKDGLYMVGSQAGGSLTFCDMTTDGGGWTMFSFRGNTLGGGAPTSGSEDRGLLDKFAVANMNIHNKNFQGIMAYHFNIDDYIIFDGFNNNLFITELKDTAGEISNGPEAQTDLGSTTHKGKILGHTFNKVSPITFFNVHRGGWLAGNYSNWAIDAGPRGNGAPVTNPLSFSNHGGQIRDFTGASSNITGPFALFFR